MNDRIIILQRILPHYRTGFFKKFLKAFPSVNILYGQPFKDESLKNDDVQNENFIKLKNTYFGKNGKFYFTGFYSKLVSYKPGIVISGFNVTNLNIYLLFFLKFFNKYKIILWSFGYDPHSGFHPDKKLNDRIRLFFYRRADAVIFYWDKGKEIVEHFSKRKDHYFVAPNTLDTDKQLELKEKLDSAGRDKIKNELGVTEKYHFVYIGRLLEDKQADLLLKAFSIIDNKNLHCRLTVIGDGPMRSALENLSRELQISKINFMGEILDEESTAKWLYISDAFVMPGRLGLSVVHSFCYSTPVISQQKNKYFHGEGIGYMKNGVNGFLTEDGNVNELADKMLEIITDPELSRRMRSNALETAKNDCSVENMIDGFCKAIEFVKKV
ncbi:MAG: glycosyltransferase family 4 protein [Ignavibacteria bacterium]